MRLQSKADGSFEAKPIFNLVIRPTFENLLFTIGDWAV